MKLAALAALTAFPLYAHMVSMSSGTLRVEGTQLIYEARIPLYEIPNIPQFDKLLFDEVHFRSRSGDAKLTKSACTADKTEGFYRCDASFTLNQPEEELDAYVGWHRVIAQNHTHVLSAMRGDVTAHAVLQASSPSAKLRFRPLTLIEQLTEGAWAGVQWLLTTPVMFLLLVAIVAASRSWPEFKLLSVCFAVGQAAPLLAASVTPVLNPRFLELASALAIAYLAVEILFLPKAGTRWLVVAVIGLFPGLALAAMVRQTELAGPGVWLGAQAIEAAVAALCGFVWLRYGSGRGVDRIAGWLLLALGAGWFAYRWFAT